MGRQAGRQAERREREPSQGFRPTFRGREEEKGREERLDLVKIERTEREEKGTEEGGGESGCWLVK